MPLGESKYKQRVNPQILLATSSAANTGIFSSLIYGFFSRLFTQCRKYYARKGKIRKKNQFFIIQRQLNLLNFLVVLFKLLRRICSNKIEFLTNTTLGNDNNNKLDITDCSSNIKIQSQVDGTYNVLRLLCPPTHCLCASLKMPSVILLYARIQIVCKDTKHPSWCLSSCSFYQNVDKNYNTLCPTSFKELNCYCSIFVCFGNS